jgi:hypothetical protein
MTAAAVGPGAGDRPQAELAAPLVTRGLKKRFGSVTAVDA